MVKFLQDVDPIMRIAGCTVLALAALCVPETMPRAAELAQVIATVKQSVVAVGTFEKTRTPPVVFNGTGFAVGDGLSIVTNAHVVLDADANAARVIGVIVTGTGAYEFRPAVAVELDREHDLALLRITGKPLAPLTLADSNLAAEGHTLAFTGYPLGMALGLNPATHRAMLAAVTPAFMPPLNARKLDPAIIGKLVSKPFDIFQIDGTAFPGNSGSPLYRSEDGAVVGIINMVWIRDAKGAVDSRASGISYAIPSNFIRDLVKRQAAASNQERNTP